ncbi:Glyoxalase domain-containing protein 5 [Purpureocillium lilacinum]|uniref:Glyoxalase domain-containing protein 5 n=1 Tax=Purpureocillium lilacinum TaxID=33203 RepID=A0A179FPK5_PURLI|nr:Glyoxalase domain-containing protein 5 [Purpureocillium lilacinum]OAQ67545.1 Glyoxalase domain-containing protein 5 [Purpureocillium lilacinum]
MADAPPPPRQPLAPVQDIDHLVLTCASIPATLTWYTSHLGMQATSFASEADPSVTRHALRFGTHKINLHQRGREFEPKAATALPGTADLCFLIDPGVDLTAVACGFADVGVEVLEGGGVVGRTGARGRIRSVYVRDPDGNLIELSQYVEQ